MIYVLCCVRDAAVVAYMRPFCVPASGAAIRGFSDEVNRAESEMHKHPEDYELFEMGTFEEETGQFELLPVPRSLARAKDFIVSKE